MSDLITTTLFPVSDLFNLFLPCHDVELIKDTLNWQYDEEEINRRYLNLSHKLHISTIHMADTCNCTVDICNEKPQTHE